MHGICIAFIHHVLISTQNLVYAGCRNGHLKRMDIRVRNEKAVSLLGSKNGSEARSITHLQMIYEWQMLLSTIRGEVSTLCSVTLSVIVHLSVLHLPDDCDDLSGLLDGNT